MTKQVFQFFPTSMGIHPRQNSNLLLNPNVQFKHSVLQSKLAIIKFKHSIRQLKHSIVKFKRSIWQFNLSIRRFKHSIC